VANAQRALATKAPLGAPHALLYGAIASAPGNYFSAFSDVAAGANGSCNGCSASAGYDTLTGLGTPKMDGLLALLSQFSATPAAQASLAPDSKSSTTISAQDMAGAVGNAMAGTIAFSDPLATRLTITIAGVPQGLELVPSGQSVLVKWATPRSGSYTLRVQTTNDLGQSAQATVRLAIR
jgi:hypothetical protein